MNKDRVFRDPPVEIAFLERHGIGRDELLRAGEIADHLRVSPDVALLGEGRVSERAFYTALAGEIGVPYFNGEQWAEADTDHEKAIGFGFVRLAPNSEGLHAVASPKGTALRLLLQSAAKSDTRLPLALASQQRLATFLRAQFADVIAERAANLVARRDLDMSAKAQASLLQILFVAIALTSVAAGSAFAPALARVLLSVGFWIIFSAAVWLRSMAFAARDAAREDASFVRARSQLRDDELPVYTIIAPLYMEGRVVLQLVRNLEALDYPRSKLDIKLVLEADDLETYEALADASLPARFDVIVAPAGATRTKPRALNIALSTARGELVTVYDAEDRPASDQLRAAAAHFAANPKADCVQARLTIHNATDSWLAEMFAIEYAILFDIFNPGLAALRLPMALGGTSNHFRISSLRRVGGWDAWNVTEDADLGIRMARFGMRIECLNSDTLEEAPHEFANWFRQRVRWQKGWMQTLIVHSRSPFEFYRQLGGWKALSAAALIVGGLSGGLFGTIFFADTLARLAIAGLVPGYSDLWYGDIVTIGLLLWGVQTLVVPAALAMSRRRIPGLARALLGMPIYFVLITLASWRALFDLIVRPFHWGKTDHGREKERLQAGEPRASAIALGE